MHLKSRQLYGRRLVAAISLLALLLPSLTVASGDPQRTAAKSKVLEGAAYLKEGEFRQALECFEEAYVLVPSPLVKYNLGLALIGLGRDADALAAFEEFLAGAPKGPPSARENAERNRTQLLKVLASLEIVSDVDGGAEVLVDGVAKGITPLKRPIFLDPGPHQIVIQKPGRPPIVQRVSPIKGERIRLMLTGLTAPEKRESKLSVAPAAASKPAPVTPPGASSNGGHTGLPDAKLVNRLAAGTEPDYAKPSHHYWQRTAGWAAAGGAGAFAIVGVVAHAIRQDKVADYNNSCSAGGARCVALDASIGRATTTMTMGYVGAGVLLASSVAFMFFASATGPNSTAQKSISLTCVPIAVHRGIDCGIRF